MGMYDSIECKYTLPLPDDVKGYIPASFQTKDFDCVLNYYEIREDGTLWIRECERDYIKGNPKGKNLLERIGTVKETKVWWTKVNTTHTINMYDFQYGDGEYDYWVEYSVAFIDGVVNKVDLVKFETTDNFKRKEASKNLIEELKLESEFKKKLRYKMFYGPYNKILRFVFTRLHKVIGFVYNKLYNWEHMLYISTTPTSKK